MPAKKTSHNKQRRIKWIAIAVFIVLLPITIFWLRNGGPHFLLDRDDPYDVVLVFTLSLMQNKEKLAKSLVAEETWPQLDSWFDAHKAARCSFPLDGDTYMMGGANRSFNEEKNQFLYEYSIIDHACSGAFYFLSVKNVVVEQTERGWQIMEWEEPCETWGLGAEECWPWE